jgi:hypothetical protein
MIPARLAISVTHGLTRIARTPVVLCLVLIARIGR